MHHTNRRAKPWTLLNGKRSLCACAGPLVNNARLGLSLIHGAPFLSGCSSHRTRILFPSCITAGGSDPSWMVSSAHRAAEKPAPSPTRTQSGVCHYYGCDTSAGCPELLTRRTRMQSPLTRPSERREICGSCYKATTACLATKT